MSVASPPVYIAGTGIISAIGDDTAACLRALKEGRSGVGAMQILQSHWAAEIPVAEVRKTNAELAAMCGGAPSWPRTALLSAVAAGEVWQPFSAALREARTGFLSANTVGGMDLTESAYPQLLDASSAMEPLSFRHHECGAVTDLVARHFGFSHFNTTISTACSSSANSIMMAAQLIRAGLLDAAVAGGADALCRFTLNGFNTLMILDRRPCQPFDQNRRGLNLGEGAGYLLLVSEKILLEKGLEPLAVLSGWANANDAYHQTASSPAGTGNVLAMQGALRTAGLLPEDISYINLHGTGTANNDSSEGAAVEKVFGGRVPPASSTKAYTGHTLGAAGGVEAVFSTWSLQEGLIYPTLRWETQMEDVAFRPATVLESGRDIRHVLSNSFGFGGNCSSLLLSKTAPSA